MLSSRERMQSADEMVQGGSVVFEIFDGRMKSARLAGTALELRFAGSARVTACIDTVVVLIH
jgi:hypothetical protein